MTFVVNFCSTLLFLFLFMILIFILVLNFDLFSFPTIRTLLLHEKALYSCLSGYHHRCHRHHRRCRQDGWLPFSIAKD